MEDGSSTVSFCPSFNCYSSESNHQVANIAARVLREEQKEDEESKSSVSNQNVNESDDFEFFSVGANGGPLFVNSDSVFPLFNRDLLLNHGGDDSNQWIDDSAGEGKGEVEVESIRLPRRKLFMEDPPSCSSSDVDELEGVPPSTYCVWAPKSSPSPVRCKKSNSTGSSSKAKWSLRDLLRRSSSDGEQSFMFLDQPNNNNNNNNHHSNNLVTTEKGKTAAVKATAKEKEKEKVSAHEIFYVRNKALKEGEKKKSYLPYRQDLVGFFANVPRTFPPF